MGKGLLISFDKENFKINADVVEINDSDNVELFQDLINAHIIDIVSLDDTFDIVVDDEGFLIEGNHVFSLNITDNELKLAGDLLILKKQMTPEGISLVGMEAGEAFNMLMKLKGNLNLIGFTEA